MPYYYRGTATLAYGVRVRVLLRYLGQLAIALTGLPALPGIGALVFGRTDEAVPYLVLAVCLLVAGLLCARIRAPEHLQRNEALTITALTFVLASGLMSWPFMSSAPTYLDALFESVSAITTTGLSTLPSVENTSPVFLFARAWTQWYGGLVIVALAIAIVLDPGAAAKRFSKGEVESEDLAGSARIRARRALFYYSGLTAAGIAGLALLGVPLLDAVVHALAGVATGGFSSRDDSIAGFAWLPVHAYLSLITLLGAISFSVWHTALQKGWRVILHDVELRLILFLCLVVGLILMAAQLWLGPPEEAASFSQTMVLAISAQTTTGFSNMDVGSLDDASKLTLIVSMFIGGDTGSTAGGLKLGRLLILFGVVSLIIFRAALPSQAVTHLKVGGHRIDHRALEGCIAVFLLYLVAIVLSWLAFALAGHDGMDALFEVTSAIGTVGLSTGLTGPDLDPLLKLVLCAEMLMGRLEIVAILILLYHRTWFARHTRTP